VKLGGLQTATSRPILLEYIRSQASDVPRSPELMPLLERPQDHSYTELWLSALSAPPKLEYVTPLSQGRQLKNGKYTIQKKLGSGGQGSAYLAVNKDSPGEIEANQLVVLKEYVLPVQVSRASRRQSLQALENETRILEKLSHAQIVSLIDYFVEDHRGYLVLEHIDGVTLRACVNEQGPMPEARVRELAVQLCDILNYLHKQTPPVVHRDFTPDNLILTNSGLVKLIDFNVAQQTSEPVTGTVVGKHAYLPPEQFRGKAVSGSDIYALGAMLSFLLTAEEPEPLSVSHPRALNRNVSEGLDLIISNATQLDSAARPTATELLKAISKL
jgi:serine/threonine-protein kinase